MPVCCSFRRAIANAEVAVYRTVEPVIINGGRTVKSLSAAFLADLEDDWRAHGKEVFPILRTKFPQAYFAGLVALSKVIRWEVGMAGEFDRSLTPDEIMVKLEQRVGPEGRELFERFLRDVNKLQMQQHLEAQAQMGVTERSGERGPGNRLATDSVTFSVSNRVDVTPFRQAAVRAKAVKCKGVTCARSHYCRFIYLPPAPANR